MNAHHRNEDKEDAPFEAQLRAQPPRALPDAWRREILAAAAAALRPTSPSARRSFAPWLMQWLMQWLWPHPAAYAALLAAWAVAFGLRMTTPDLEPDLPADVQMAQMARDAHDPADGGQTLLYASLRQQREWLSLAGNLEEGRP